MGWLSGYSYRRQITIEGTADGAQTDYQLKLLLNRDYPPFYETGVCEPFGTNDSPAAYYYNGKTYIAFQGPNSDPYIDYYDHATATWHGAIQVGTNPLTNDSHGAPTVIVDDDGYIHVFYGCHGTAIKYAISDNPEDISAWTAQDDIGTECTYPMVIKDADGVLWLFTRDDISDPEYYSEVYRKSTDWSTSYEIIQPETTADIIYAGCPDYDVANGRIHIAWTHTDTTAGKKINQYHAYLDMADEHMYSMNETDLGTLITFAEAETYCKIVSDTTYDQGFRSPLHLDSNGYPHIMYLRVEGSERYIFYIFWNGSVWSTPAKLTDVNVNAGVHDFYITSPTDIDAYVCRGSRSFTRFHWNGSAWDSGTEILDDALMADRFPPRNSHIVVDGVAGLRVVVAEAWSADYTTADKNIYAIDSDDNFVHPNNRIGLEGHCLDDFADIRFTKSDGTTELDYWLEEYVSTDDAVFWIEFDSIPADPSTGTFYIYYGKAGDTTTSNPVNTLVKYEDFEDADTWDDDLVDIGTPIKTRDTVVYKIGTASLGLEDDDAAVAEGVYIAFTSSTNRRFTFYARAIQANKNISWSLTSGGSSVCVINFSTSGTIVYTDNTTIKTAQDYSADIWYKFEICAHIADALWDLYIDDVLIAANITTYSVRTLALSRMYSRTVAVADMPTWWLDHLLIFNWTPNEPAWGAWGSEEAIVVSGLYYYKHLMGGNS